MKRESLDKEWKFASGASSVYTLLMPNNNTVNLPHDFTIASEVKDTPGGKDCGFYVGGIAHYTKKIFIPEECKDERLLIEFDGSYMNTEVSLNGYFIELHPYGYSPFIVDITKYVEYGKENRLEVQVNNSAPDNARWYSGSGILRHVNLLRAGKVHLSPWSIFVRTDKIANNNAYLSIDATVENHGDEPFNGRIHFRAINENKNGITINASTYISVEPQSKSTVKVPLVIGYPMLWDVDSPKLYQLAVDLSENEILDSETVEFGIRTISINRIHGFRLNGRTLKLKGGCVHHGNGLLGGISLYDSEYRRMKLHKDNGFNAVRSAHNPPSSDMLKACDKLGLLVMDEIFDVWKMQKNSNDYHLYFDDWWKRDMEASMKRDRNHPSIFAWSIGNEIVERSVQIGYELANDLSSYAKSIDNTRFITSAVPIAFSGLNDTEMMGIFMGLFELSQKDSIQNLGTPYANSIFSKKLEKFAEPLDFVGYNYLEYRYKQDGEENKNIIICGTESYPGNFDNVWRNVEDYSYVIGDFAWTSYDYIGEAGLGMAVYSEDDVRQNPLQGPPVLYPWRLAYCGDFDLCGFDRAQLHYRKIVWGSDETYIHVHNPQNYGKKEFKTRWSWTEGFNSWSFFGYEDKPVNADVYSKAEEVELLVNGKSVGKKPAGEKNRFLASFNTTYQKGTITAISYTGGKEVSRQELRSANKPTKLKISLEKDNIKADGNSLAYVLVEICDEDGNRVNYGCDTKLKAEVTGCGTLAAFGTGRPVTSENYTTGEFTSFEGRAQAIIRSSYESGDITITIKSEIYGECSATIKVE